ncbi:peptidase M2 [Wolbachia endosymbiont (group A) of Anthophora plumipes]|uniref:peptidase M2 n=1 Tax=Wolbachia endosymbiont (group A) of Anthophora plumipes TaxID=3066194 RepID=UPI00333EB443
MTINQQINKNITKEEYFNNNGKGFNSPHVVEVKDLNIKVEVYSHNLRASKIATIESEIKETATSFKDTFKLEHSNSEQTFKIYMFDDKDDYTHLGGSERFGSYLGDEGGKCYYKGEADVFAEMYVYQQGGVHNLQHEFAHGLTYLATGGKHLPTVLMEGIADYFEHHSDHKFNSQGSSIDKTEAENLDLDKILSLEYSKDSEANSLVYKTGHALIMYLQEKDPSLLRDYLDALRQGNSDESKSFLKDIKGHDADFKSWLDISKEYHFLKAVKTADGQVKLTYSDQQGNEYQNSQEYKNQALRILSKYDTEIKNQVDEFDNLNKERGEMYQKYHKGEITIEELRNEENTKYRPAFLKFDQLKNKAVDKIENNSQAAKILDGLVNIDPNLIRGTHIDLQEGKIFSMQAHGQGNMGALSIYDGNAKLGELLSESGFFKQVEGQTKETFVFEDILHNLNVQYDGSAYMAVTKENGHYKASLIDGRTVERDEYFDEAHLHENELLHPSTGHIQKDLDSLLLRGTKILNHQDSEHAQYSDEQKANGVIVEKGKLLDNKGTDRTDDDVYEAVVKQGDERLHEFKNMGFYITEEVKNERGEITNGSNLFIHDHGKNVRYELPEKVTHLKLVQKDGQYKLAPSDSEGREYNGIPDEYRYIDPIFAHEYEKRDYSHKHVNVGLINLEKYGSGKLFAIKYDPNDYQIQRNSSGEIVRIKDQAYFTKVKLFDGDTDEEIGMLSNNFHNFKGKIFFSADYNYSYNDFLASVSPQVEIEDMGNGSKKITFDQGDGDIGDTNRGYTDYQRIFTKEKQTESPKGQVSETKTEVDTSHISHNTTNVVAQAAEERTVSNDNSEMQSDQPQIPTRAKRSSSVEEKEQVLKDTILKIEKSYEQDSEGKHKANVTIDYHDLKALYNRAEGEDKNSVLKFWHKLAESGYKVGALPEDKYYFKDGKFVIRDSDAGKCILLPADKVSIKIVKDGNHYDLAISNNDNGKVISSIGKIGDLNYGLLSGTNEVSLETQDSTIFLGQHNEYNSYLENGFVKMFDCASDHIYHDHNSAYI